MKKLLTGIFLLLIISQASAQFKIAGLQIGQYQVKFNMTNISYGINTGSVYSLTDVGGKKWEGRHSFVDMQLPQTKFMIGAFARLKILPKNHSFTTSLNYFRLGGSDLLSPGTSREPRGYVFKTSMFESHSTYEYNFFSYKFVKQNLDCYASAGLDFFFNRPKLYQSFSGETPRPLAIDPKHHNLGFGTPIGFGAYLTHKKSRIVYGLDFSWRKTYTDYLDGFTRPWGKRKDSYCVVSLQASYMFANVYLKKSQGDKAGPSKGKHADEYNNFFMRKSKFSRNNSAQQKKMNKKGFKKFGKKKGRV
ncbi:MAG: DUF6089 family protein [Bacteroidota bacterium]